MNPTYLRPQFGRFISLLVCGALLVSMFVATPHSSAKSPRQTKPPAPVVNPQGNSQRQRQPLPRDNSRKVDPVPLRTGPPAANLPNLDELKRRKPDKPEAPAPIPSTVRSRRKLLTNGNKISSNSPIDDSSEGAGIATRQIRSRTSNRSVRSHHARLSAPTLSSIAPASATAPLAPVPQSASNVALNKTATQSSTYQGAGGALPGLAVDGNTSGNWWPDFSVTSTNADTHAWWKVDLGATYSIQSVEVWNRTDCCGDRLTNFNVILLDNNEAIVSTVNFPGQAGTPSTISISGAARYVKIELAGTNYLSLAEVRVWGTAIAGASASERALARLDPFNQPGNQLQARDCEWSLPLVSLPGRSGLDLGLTLSYSSMVWTRAGNAIYFDEDNGNPSPGFRLGFPTLGNLFLDTQANVNARMMVTSSGRHVEFRYAGHNNNGGFDLYKAGDSSYAELLDYGNNDIWLRTTDGMNINFALRGSELHALLLRDRNGNMITAGYNGYGDITSVTDTLGRVINFNYDTNLQLNSITQTWNGQTHAWATFGWETKSFTPAFSVPVVGSYANIPVLNQVGLADGSYYKFEYNNFGQVNLIRRLTSDGDPGPTGDIERARQWYDYDTTQPDCPRIMVSHVTAENWQTNVQTIFEDLGIGWHRMTMPDGSDYRERYELSGWQRGLVFDTETWGKDNPGNSSSQFKKQKSTSIQWTQDNTGVSYQLNPRVIESIIDDQNGNHRRTTVDYGAYAQYGLPYCVTEYANNGSTPWRQTYTDYNLSQPYVDWHILGLASEVKVFDSLAGKYLSKSTYGYDEVTVGSEATNAIQHHQSFSQSLNVRANVTSVARWDVDDIENTAKAHTTQLRYNAAGSMLSITDPNPYPAHTTTVSYADAFTYDGTNGYTPHDVVGNAITTLAYPTTVTDADGHSSSIKYDYDFGAVRRTQNPLGAAQTVTYDGAGRVDRVTTGDAGAYRKYLYYSSWFATVDTINQAADEAVNFNSIDGLGRVWMNIAYSASGGTETRAQWTIYDVMGRPAQQSNPAVIDGSWTPIGDDAAGWIFTQQTYDWKGRPLRTIHPDGYYTELSYTGCGCAGGEVVTATDENNRARRTTYDVLGRLIKSEELNPPDPNTGVRSTYSTANYVYDALDRIKTITHEEQQRTFDYDGYGRLHVRTTPEQGATTYEYNADDTLLSVKDARQVITNYGYNNNRHLVSSISYDESNDPSGNTAYTAPVSFGYDAAGNRTSMTYGLGSVSYHYDPLSRMDWEERSFGVLGPYRLTYGYNLANELTSITGPSQFGSVQVSYDYDTNGRLHSVGSGSGDVSSYAGNISYRAFGEVKAMSFGDGRSLSASYDNRMRPTSRNVSNVLGYSYSYLEHTDRVNYARNLSSNGGPDSTLDRSYEYDQVGALVFAHSGAEARAAFGIDGTLWGNSDGPYSHRYDYDQQGNMIRRFGWGGEVQGGARNGGDTTLIYNYSTNKNQRDGLGYDAAGNVTYDGYYNTYNVSNQQTLAESGSYILAQYYDGDGLRVTKYDNGPTTNYLRSTVLGGAVVLEINANNNSAREYVYAGSNLLAVQSGSQISWIHEDPITKSQRVTDASGNVINTIELDPWGANTDRSSASPFQPQTFTTYIRDGNGQQDAMARRYSVSGRFSQPDPYGGSYNFSDPQSLNRYAYTKNDPVNRRDPSGLDGDDDPYAGLEFGGTLVTNSKAPRWRGGITGFLGTGTEGIMIETGSEGGGEPGGGGTGPNLPAKMARCLALAKKMVGPLKEIKRLEKNYNPVLDFLGGYPIKKTLPSGQVIDLGNSKPGGHYQGMTQQQESLRKSWEAFKRECIDDDSNDFRPPPIPADARQYAYKKWTPPHAPDGTPRTFWDDLKPWIQPPPLPGRQPQPCWWCLPWPPPIPVWN